MTKTALHGNTLLALASIFLFVSLVPVVDFFVHPVSVMYGEYVPLIVRLSDLYWTSGFLSVSSIAVPILLLALTLLTQSRRFGFKNSLVLLVAPFSLAILIQYFVAVQLDAELRSAWYAHPIQWHYVFQLPFMVYCFVLILIYASVAASVWFVLATTWRAVSCALTRRSG